MSRLDLFQERIKKYEGDDFIPTRFIWFKTLTEIAVAAEAFVSAPVKSSNEKLQILIKATEKLQ